MRPPARKKKKRTTVLPPSLQDAIESLKSNDPALTRFFMSHKKRICCQLFQSLGSSLSTNTSLKWLYLEGTNLGTDKSLDSLVTALRPNRSVENLYLYSNKIDDAGAAALASLFVEGPPIKVLALYENKIGSDGATALINSIQCGSESDGHYALERLDLRENKIGTEGAMACAEMLSSNTNLKYLFLQGNEITAEGKKKLIESVKRNYFLEHFGMDYDGSDQKEEVDFYLRLNRAGRRFLRVDNAPPALWGKILTKLEPDLMHYFLKANPRLFMAPREKSSTTSSKKRVVEEQDESSMSKRIKRASKNCTTNVREMPDMTEQMQLTMKRGTSKAWWGVWLSSIGGMCVVARAHTSSQLRPGDAILSAESNEASSPSDDDKDCHHKKKMVRLFRACATVQVAVKRAQPVQVTIKREAGTSWGIWLEGRSSMCMVVGVLCDDKSQGLCSGDIIWSVMDETKEKHVSVPTSGADWYQRVIELFKKSDVLHLVIGRLGPPTSRSNAVHL